MGGVTAVMLGGSRARGEELPEPGAWGPWVDGGGWLSIDGMAVDWIYRDLDRVHQSWQAAEAGSFSFHFQVGHPLGVPDFAYAGEVALRGHHLRPVAPGGRRRLLRLTAAWVWWDVSAAS